MTAEHNGPCHPECGHVFTRREFSGVCVCTHGTLDHHGNMILNQEAARQMGEFRMAGECEFYGCNECTDDHCVHFWDKDNPEPDPYAKYRKADPSAKVGGCKPWNEDDYEDL